MKHASLILILLAALLLAACPVEETSDTAATAGSAASTPPQAGALAGNAADPEQPAQAPRQFVLIYSGDTLSMPATLQGYDPPEGGLCALGAAVTDYMALITGYNRQRVLNEGGDAGAIRTDLEQGLLGEHPFMLLDYGGWERPNDFAGEHYVALYLKMYDTFGYSAVGAKLYEQLAPGRWDAYRPLVPENLTVLNSAGTPLGDAIPTVPVITREIHGARWGVVSVPMPEKTEGYDTKLTGYIETAAGLLAQTQCAHGILMLPGAPGLVYTNLKTDPRFTAVVGAARGKSVPEGYGTMPEQGAVLLPEVNPGGRSIGICHFYYGEDATAPDMFFFTTMAACDDGTQPLPFRPQVEAAIDEHRRVVGETLGGGA